MKYSLLIFFLFSFCPLFNGQVFAEGGMNIRNINVEMKEISFARDQEEYISGNPMIIYNEERFLPLREVMELSNHDVNWNTQTKSIYIGNKQKIDNTALLSNENSQEPRLSFDASISAKGGIILEDASNHVMFEKNSQLKFYPASTVKIMTALLALESGNLNDVVTVSETVKELPYDSRIANIRPGDQLTLKQLLYGMLLYSGNDTAVVIAEHIAGSEEAFIELMNQKAKEIGAMNTNFVNPHGYHDPNQYTTPYDLALITKEAAKNKTFINIINTPYYRAEFKNKNGKKVIRHWDTTNQFLKNDDYEFAGILGGKTGYTDASQHNLVTIAENEGHQYISVILKGSYWERYRDTRKLLKGAYHIRNQYNLASNKSISADFNINRVIYNGFDLSHQRKVFLYRNRAYISEELVKEMFEFNVRVNQSGLYQLNINTNQSNSEINKHMNMVKPFLSPIFGVFSPFNALSHALTSKDLLNYSLEKYKYQYQNRNPFYHLDVKKITVKVEKPYLRFRNIRL